MPKVTVTLDGQKVEVEQGTNLIEVARSVGQKIPHFCYHRGLSPDGNCRMCLVQVEKMPKPVIGCMTGATEGMVVHTKTPEVEKMRQSIMEFLLIDHPLDCPTCDQAGECKLQDYYMKYDKIPSRFDENKVEKKKMLDLGAGVLMDEERCITCTRCVRFCKEIAKDEELYVMNRGNKSTIGIFPTKPMKNPYAGNTVDVCPVGALTSKDFRYKKRVWFLQTAKSICPGCSRGCNINLDHNDKQVYRLKPRRNTEVNDFWMCDAGRNDYTFINEERRLKPVYKLNQTITQTDYQSTLDHLKDVLAEYTLSQVAFVASAQESNQAIDAFVSCAKDHFDADHVYYSSHQPQNPYSDDILITADKNPNMKHIEASGLKALNTLSHDVKAIFVQRNLSDADLKFVQDKGLKVVALFATNRTAVDALAETIFPIATYAEQAGSFTNCNGLVQNFEKAFDPRGEARVIEDYLEDLKSQVRDFLKAS